MSYFAGVCNYRSSWLYMSRRPGKQILEHRVIVVVPFCHYPQLHLHKSKTSSSNCLGAEDDPSLLQHLKVDLSEPPEDRLRFDAIQKPATSHVLLPYTASTNVRSVDCGCWEFPHGRLEDTLDKEKNKGIYCSSPTLIPWGRFAPIEFSSGSRSG